MNTTTYDPTTTATSLATAYIEPAQKLLTAQTGAATATATALTKLQSALSAFSTALQGLSSKKSVLAHTATFSDASVGTATASASAVAGRYSFFVEQLATASQVAFGNLDAVPAAEGGTVTVNLGGGAHFAVDIGGAADLNGDGTLQPAEIATAINSAPDNDSQVTASVVTVGGHAQMILSAGATGAAGAISLDTSALYPGALATSLGSGTTLVAAQDAVVWLGAQATGVRLQQASNTFDAIAGVSMTFGRTMVSGEAPVTLDVATDASATTANAQSFVDAYNTLEGVLDSLTNHGDPAHDVAAAIFANDAGVASLRSRITTLLRQNVSGETLANYGISANRDGTLALDSTRLLAKLAVDPSGLGAVFGKTGLTTGTGVLGGLDQTMNLWTNSLTGQIKQRQSSVTTQQNALAARQTTLDNQYNSAYARYLAQFTQLQNLQTQMAQTSSMFDALFSSSSS